MKEDCRNFDTWLSEFKPTIASFDYYVDFDKCIVNAEKWRPEIHLMNSLIGSKNIKQDFLALCEKYPDVLHVIPILLAIRNNEILILESEILVNFNFGAKGDLNTPQEYADFMQSTGLFEIMECHIINNLYDYIFGIEVGLDSNGRKNRGGHLMENLVESYLIQAGLKRCEIKGETFHAFNPNEFNIYCKELKASQAQELWGIDLSPITNNGTVEKRFDFVVKTKNKLFGIETNFYSGGGSKLNETSRSYKEMAQEANTIDDFTFVWVTDGQGWISARNNLHETFETMETIYNLADLQRGAFKKLFRDL
jgi:type II restriction-modification system restriction subunit